MDQLARTPQQLSAILQTRRRLIEAAQSEIASKVGLRQKTISLIETDASRSSVATLFRLLSALDLELVVRDRSKATAKDAAW